MASSSLKLPNKLYAIFQWRSLKTRLTIFMLLILLTGIWSLYYSSSRMLREDMRHMLSEQQFSTISIMANQINQELTDRSKLIEEIASGISPAMLGNAATMKKYLEDRLGLQMMFNGGVSVSRLDGLVIADFPTVQGRIGTNYMDREWMPETLKGKTTIGKPVMGKTMHAPIFVIATPIRDTRVM